MISASTLSNVLKGRRLGYSDGVCCLVAVDVLDDAVATYIWDVQFFLVCDNVSATQGSKCSAQAFEDGAQRDEEHAAIIALGGDKSVLIKYTENLLSQLTQKYYLLHLHSNISV